MILNDLCDLYDLKRESVPEAIPERYWCRKRVSWEVVIDGRGKPMSVIPLVEGENNAPKLLVVPDVQRTSGVRPFFLCENAEYLLAADAKRGAQKQCECIEFHREVLSDVDDDGAKALLLLIDRFESGEKPAVLSELVETPKDLVVFRLLGDEMYVHEREKVRLAWNRYKESRESELSRGLCMVYGEEGPLAPLFPQVTGLPGAQSSGASLISCNADAFSSYGQKLSSAGSISVGASDKAGAALAYVLKDRGHHVQMGNDHIAFWTDAFNPKIDADLAFLIDPDVLMRNEDNSVRESVQTALLEMRAGKRPDDTPKGTTYHLLGIAPYQARLAVRFYETGSMGKLLGNVTQYLKDTEMDGAKPCSMRALLEQTAPQGDSKRLPTTLVTSCMRAYVRGTSFPTGLMQKVITRMRMDHGSNKPWDMGRRAALLKACLIRSARARGTEQGDAMERRLTVGLNIENDNQGYLLGRLFALLEKAQQDAVRGANATIRDRYMGAAAATPARVFPQLLKLAQHHISKGEYGGLMDRRIQEVVSQMGDSGFPKTLSFDDQGMFYIGYYQQKQALYAKAQEFVQDDEEDQ